MKWMMWLGSALVGFLLAGTLPVHAQSSKVIRLQGPFEAGSFTDQMTRAIAEHVSDSLGQPVIVENKPGAGGVIAGRAVVNAAPDGSILLIGTVTSTAGVAALNKKPAYDPVAVFSSITRLGYSTAYLYANADLPINTVTELVAYGRNNPGKLRCGTAHSTGRIACAKLEQLGKIKMVEVPYKGEAALMPDIVSGRIEITFGTPGVLMPQVKEGKLKLIATLMPERTKAAANVPTMKEAGMTGFINPGWTAVFAPKETPLGVRERLAKAFNLAMQQPDVKDLANQIQFLIGTSAPEEMDRFLANEVTMYKKTVEDSSILVE